MTTYIEYELDENTTILVEAPEDASSVVKHRAPVRAQNTFKEAWKGVKVQAKMLIEEVEKGEGDRGIIKKRTFLVRF